MLRDGAARLAMKLLVEVEEAMSCKLIIVNSGSVTEMHRLAFTTTHTVQNEEKPDYLFYLLRLYSTSAEGL